jgi:hypothetical protein
MGRGKAAGGANTPVRKNDWSEAVQTRDFAALRSEAVSSQRIIQYKIIHCTSSSPLITVHILFLPSTNDFFSVSKMKRLRRSELADVCVLQAASGLNGAASWRQFRIFAGPCSS